MERAYLMRALAGTRIPDYMWDGLVEFILNGRPTGSFLTAVLESNLLEAVLAADETNIQLLADYVAFLRHYAPAESWGTPKRVKTWIRLGGVIGVVIRTGATKKEQDDDQG